MTWQVRRVTANDGPVLRELQLAACAEAPHAFGPVQPRLAALSAAAYDQLAAERAVAPCEATFIAWTSNRAVGLASITQEAGRGYLSFVWVHPSCRGGKLAETLLAQLLAWGCLAGHVVLYCRVTDENVRALSFYERLGWRTFGQEPWPSNPLRFRYLLVKTLSPETPDGKSARPY